MNPAPLLRWWAPGLTAALTALLVGALGCDDEQAPAGRLDMAVDAGRPDAGPTPDARAPDATIEPDAEADAEPDMMPQPDAMMACSPATMELPDEAQAGDDGAWRVEPLPLSSSAREARCPGETRLATRGREAVVRFTAVVEGEHVFVARGEVSALYALDGCEPDSTVRACAPLVELPGGEPGATAWSLSLDLAAGETVDLVLDTPLTGDAVVPPIDLDGPRTLVIFPPRPEGERCPVLFDAPGRWPCGPGLVCLLGQCERPSPPVIDGGRAYSDGQSLRLEIDASDAGGDLLATAWVRRGEDEPFVQLETIIAERGEVGLRYAGFTEAPGLPLAEMIEVELLDRAQIASRQSLSVEPAPARGAGEPCDALGTADTCADGGACIEGRCLPGDGGAWRTVDSLHLVYELPLAGLDPFDYLTVSAEARLIGADGLPLSVEWTRVDVRPSEDGLLWGGVIGDPVLEAQAIEVRLQAPERPPALPIALPIEALPIREPGEPCDPARIADTCAEGSACFGDDRRARCALISPPALEDLHVYFGAGALGLVAFGGDAEGDIVGYQLQVFGEDDELRFESGLAEFPPDAAVDFGQIRFSIDAPWQPRGTDVVVFNLFDAEDLTSPVLERNPRPAPVAIEGDLCDLRGGLNQCAPATLCAQVRGGDAPRCEPKVVECPDDWRVSELPFDEYPIVFEDSSRRGPDSAAGVCGGGGTPEMIYRWVPEQDGVVPIFIEQDEAFLYVRRYCGLPRAELSELACELGQRVEVDVLAGETYFIFIDGPDPRGRRFRLHIGED